MRSLERAVLKEEIVPCGSAEVEEDVTRGRREVIPDDVLKAPESVLAMWNDAPTPVNSRLQARISDVPRVPVAPSVVTVPVTVPAPMC